MVRHTLCSFPQTIPTILQSQLRPGWIAALYTRYRSICSEEKPASATGGMEPRFKLKSIHWSLILVPPFQTKAWRARPASFMGILFSSHSLGTPETVQTISSLITQKLGRSMSRLCSDVNTRKSALGGKGGYAADKAVILLFPCPGLIMIQQIPRFPCRYPIMSSSI